LKIFGKNFKINASIIILAFLTLFIIISLIFVILTDNRIVLSIFGSLVAGLIVAIIQFVIAWQDYNETEKLSRLELIEIMYNRDDRVLYEKLINKAKREIKIMGVTAIRFLRDFADYDESAPQNAKILLSKLGQGVKINIILPDIKFLPDEKKNDYDKVMHHIKILKQKFQNDEIVVKYFNHNSAHSIFVIDDTCIVGPVFPKIESKNTSALHLKNTSPLAKQYLDYFAEEWKNAI